MSVRGWIKAVLPDPVLELVRRQRDLFRARRSYGGQAGSKAVLDGMKSSVRPRHRILFYPQAPFFPHVAFKLCALLGCLIAEDPRNRYDVVFKRQGATFFDQSRLSEVDLPLHRIVNAGSVDISKSNVGRRFVEVFGYPLAVDPLTHPGPMVEKSDQNAAHDGRILVGPIPPEEVRLDRVYQRVVDNRASEEGLVVDHRVPIHGGRIPLVYVKHRPEERRFGNDNAYVHLADPASVFEQDEVERILAFARLMGIDYGELDVLRDRDDRIYVVDANNTPAGPPNGLTEADQRRAVRTLAESFDELLWTWRV